MTCVAIKCYLCRYLDYVIDEHETFRDESHRDGELFRRRFRVPFMFITQVIDTVKRDATFSRAETDATGRPAAPIELLVLGVFRVLGRRWAFDDLYEATFISAEDGL